MRIVGLTGGIATGKSTTSALFAQHKIPIIDADVVAREVVQPGRIAWKRIRSNFGEEVFLPDGQLNRPKLGEIIFSDPVKRRKLNSITHPMVILYMLYYIFYYFIRGYALIILDIPLLFEGSSGVLCHETILVDADDKIQLARLMVRNTLSQEDAEKRMAAQMPMAEKRRRASYRINNNGSIDELKIQIDTLVGIITPRWTFSVYHLAAIIVAITVVWRYVL